MDMLCLKQYIPLHITLHVTY